MTDDEWIEQFYTMLEKGFDNYKRPADYRERAKRILEGSRKPVTNQREGATKWNSND